MSIQLGRWDCLSCGQKGNPGNETSCSACGSPRGKDVEFYLPENAAEITDETLLKEANAGVDWICDYCGADNKATLTSCKSCGNERSKDDINRNTKEYGLDNTPHNNAKKKPQNIETPPPNKTSVAKKLLYGGAVIFLLLAIILWPRSMQVEVVKHTWERAIEIENNRLVTEEDWNVPAGAQLKESFRALHHNDSVLDHYENKTRTVKVEAGSESYKCGKTSKGNGYFEDKYCSRTTYRDKTESYQDPVYRSVPVYRTKYRYTLYRWLKDHDIKEQGLDKNVRWPHEDLKGDKWREGKKTEKYTLFYKSKKGKEYTEETDYSFWNKVNNSQELAAKTNAMGSFFGVIKEQVK